MFKLISFIFTGCWHDWYETSKHNLSGDGGARGIRYIYTCSKCGKHKKQDII